MLKKIVYISLILSSISLSQFKDKDLAPVVSNGITNYSTSGFFTNFFNPNNFRMNHSVSMSYSSFGGSGVILNSYTNSMAYRFRENLNVEVDASVVASPYSSLGKEHQNSINGIYLSRVQLNYSPIKDMYLTIQYLNLPPGSYYNRSSYWGSSIDRRRFRTGF